MINDYSLVLYLKETYIFCVQSLIFILFLWKIDNIQLKHITENSNQWTNAGKHTHVNGQILRI